MQRGSGVYALFCLLPCSALLDFVRLPRVFVSWRRLFRETNRWFACCGDFTVMVNVKVVAHDLVHTLSSAAGNTEF